MTPFTTSTEQDGDVIRIAVLLSTDPGPVRAFQCFLEFDLDEAHATELLGELSIALQKLRAHNDDRAPRKVLRFPVERRD